VKRWRVLAARAAASWRTQRERWLLAGAALALAVGMFGPVLPWRRSLVDEVVVLDITQSMNVQDQRLDGKPASRLAYAKLALGHALLALPCGSRVGWAVFTEYRSYLLVAPVEVCAHLDELRATLAAIDNRMAWAGASEIAKGLHSGLAIARQLPGTPALVFVTDGHESPPLNPQHRPAFDDKPGAVRGLVVGVGGPVPAPIPKTDPEGRPLGFWGADDVQQSDLRSRVRGASVDGEQMAEGGAAPPDPALGAAPGREHLSSLHEDYLRLLAGELGLAYRRLDDADGLVAAMRSPELARPVRVRADARVALALLALLLLLLRHLPQARRGNSTPRGRGAGIGKEISSNRTRTVDARNQG
jgi:mxaL protein